MINYPNTLEKINQVTLSLSHGRIDVDSANKDVDKIIAEYKEAFPNTIKAQILREIWEDDRKTALYTLRERQESNPQHS